MKALPNPPVPLSRVQEILSAGANIQALVVGDLMLDEYISGRVDRISPEAPVPVVRVEEERWAVGGAANVAANVKALGARCPVIGLAGHDDGGDRLVKALEDLGARTDGVVRTKSRPTSVKTRVMARHHQIVRFDREEDSDIPPEGVEMVLAAIRRIAPECDVLIMEDYNKGLLVPEVIEAVLAEARTLGIPTIVDPKRLRFFDFKGCTIFKPNAKELADALGEHLAPEDPDWMHRTRERLECSHLLLTLGEKGVALATDDGGYLRIPAFARDVYDVSGAGDTVTAVMAVSLAAGASPPEAAILANHAAAIEVGKAGVATVTPDELLDHYRNFHQKDN